MKKHLIRDIFLQNLANKILRRAGYEGPLVSVFWNKKLRTTAGLFTKEKNKKIHLNTVLKVGKFRKHLLCTLRHELAHILAYYRSGSKISFHGPEWRQACKDLGIPKEKRTHDLQIRGIIREIKVARKFFYRCPSCGEVDERVKPYKSPRACHKCVRKYRGKVEYHPRFRLLPMPII